MLTCLDMDEITRDEIWWQEENKLHQWSLATLGKGNVGDTWDSCCDKACNFGRSIGGSEYPKKGQTIRCWNPGFRSHRVFLRNESRSKKTDIPLPRIFLDYPDEAIKLRAFICTNLEKYMSRRCIIIFMIRFYYGLHIVVLIGGQMKRSERRLTKNGTQMKMLKCRW